MNNYLSYAEADELCDGMIRQYIGKDAPIPAFIDIDGFVMDFLHCRIIYETFAEDDRDKVGFTGDGKTPLRVRRNSMVGTIVLPPNTVVLERFLLRPEEEKRRRFVLGHEAGHIIANRINPDRVNIHMRKGPFIVVSGHDLKDLEMLLEQTKGTGVNVYTHGEMLPCHGYEGLKKYPHLVGNFGGAWQDQQKQFDDLPGCILMTTNCLMRPRESYKGRIYSTNVVGWEGVKHIGKKENGEKDFSEIIQQAIELGGYPEDQEPHEILVGFGHHSVLSDSDKIVAAVKAGKIRHFFLIGGCDGARPGRNYYTEFAKMVPKDCVILTLACGKYRFNKLDFGEVAGLPRLLDVGQCNDVYSAIRIATGLADAFGTDVNGLPLSLIVSWYEQKAVADLLALLSLGIKGIYLGPTLPAFLSPNVLQYLVDTFDLRLITNAEDDIKTCLKQNI